MCATAMHIQGCMDRGHGHLCSLSVLLHQIAPLQLQPDKFGASFSFINLTFTDHYEAGRTNIKVHEGHSHILLLYLVKKALMNFVSSPFVP